MSTSQKEIKKEKFSATEHLSQDFMRMIWILVDVKSILEKMVAANENFKEVCNSIEFIRQDIKTLENAKNAILDEKIVIQLENSIQKKKEELEKKEKEKTENSEKISKLSIAYKEFEYYASIVKNIHDSFDVISFIDIDGLSIDEHIAFLFSGISLDLETINESSSQYSYEKAKDLFNTAHKVIEELSKK